MGLLKEIAQNTLRIKGKIQQKEKGRAGDRMVSSISAMWRECMITLRFPLA